MHLHLMVHDMVLRDSVTEICVYNMNDNDRRAVVSVQNMHYDNFIVYILFSFFLLLQLWSYNMRW